MFTTTKAIPAPKNTTTQDITELYYIVEIDTLKSILQHGILSRNSAKNRHILNPANDCSNPDVQYLREKSFKSPYDNIVRPLHDYVNFYIQPRNAMMYAIDPEKQSKLCILGMNKSLLNRPGAVVTIGNAACHGVKFYQPKDWKLVPPWGKVLKSTHISGSSEKLDETTATQYKQLRQSEVLILDSVTAERILHIYVYDNTVVPQISEILADSNRNNIMIDVRLDMFPYSEERARKRYVENTLFAPTNPQAKKTKNETSGSAAAISPNFTLMGTGF